MPGPEDMTGAPDWQHRFARFLSHLFSPAAMAVWVFAGLGILRPGETDWKALGIALALFTLLPCAVMVLLRRRGLEDVYAPEPALRQRILLMGTACYLTGFLVLSAVDAAPIMTWSAASITLAAAAVRVIDRFWKISIHSVGVAAGVFVLVTVGGAGQWPQLAAPPLVAWARLRLGAHTVPQLLAGILLGALVPALLLPHFR